MLARSVKELKAGINTNGVTIYAFQITQGRFREEFNIDLHARYADQHTNLLYAKVFYGRMPDYRPWVELFSINNDLAIGDRTFRYFGSAYEAQILAHFARFLGAGEKILIEYADDSETGNQLSKGVPVVLTRLGFILFSHGFTWFKDWYFPEGYLEGNPKLQAEKPLDLMSRERHKRTISEELTRFSHRITELEIVDHDLERAMERCAMIIGRLQS